MRRWTATFGALGLMFASSYALADETVDGVLDRVDQEAGTISLADGQDFVLKDGYEFTDIQPGEKVTVSYTVENGQNVVTSIIPAESSGNN